MRLEGKITLVTGAAQGIGRATAMLFSQEGASVICVDVNKSGGQETVESIRQRGGDAEFIEADISKPEDVQKMALRCSEQYGRLHILFNNAGIIHWATMEELKLEDWDRLIAVNLTGPFLCSKYMLPALKAAGIGSIINNATIDAVLGNPRVVAYSVSKGGLIPLTHVMAYELAKYNIRVNCLCPAGIGSRPDAHLHMFETFRQRPGSAAMMDNLLKATPLGRFGHAEEVAAVALFLASDESSYVTGTVLMVDGGRSAITPGTVSGWEREEKQS